MGSLQTIYKCFIQQKKKTTVLTLAHEGISIQKYYNVYRQNTHTHTVASEEAKTSVKNDKK